MRSPCGVRCIQVVREAFYLFESVTVPLRGEMHPFGSFFSSRYNNVTAPLRGGVASESFIPFTATETSYRPLAGVRCILVSCARWLGTFVTDPLRGEMQFRRETTQTISVFPRCRPLTGVRCIHRKKKNLIFCLLSYRPLAGVRCISYPFWQETRFGLLPTPCGEKMHPQTTINPEAIGIRYRPLEGVSCIDCL